MNNEVFEIVKLVLQIALIIITAFIVPAIRKYLNANTTKKERDEAVYWIKLVTVIAESIYKEKGQGKLKKEYVTEWLNKNSIKINEEQLSVLIDMVVKEYNEKGWNEVLLDE